MARLKECDGLVARPPIGGIPHRIVQREVSARGRWGWGWRRDDGGRRRGEQDKPGKKQSATDGWFHAASPLSPLRGRLRHPGRSSRRCVGIAAHMEHVRAVMGDESSGALERTSVASHRTFGGTGVRMGVFLPRSALYPTVRHRRGADVVARPPPECAMSRSAGPPVARFAHAVGGR